MATTGWIRRLRQAAGDGSGLTRRAADAVDDAARAFRAGDRDAAAERGGAAVLMLRELVAQGVRAAEPVLVRALGNQSGYLAVLQRQAEALALAEEAAVLARAEPGRAQQLATALVTLANRLVQAGRTADALEAVREARVIVEVRPDPELARALTALAEALVAEGEHAEAVVISERALEMWRLLADRDAAAEAHLGPALSGHAGRLYALGRWADAVEFGAEAVSRHRRTSPELLAGALQDQAMFLSRVGRQEEALAAADEAERESPAS